MADIPANLPSDTEYSIEFSAKMGLYHYSGETSTYPPSHFQQLIPDSEYSQIMDKIRAMNLVEEMLKVSFDILECDTRYDNDDVIFTARFVNSAGINISREINDFMSCFNEISFDGYLEGDAVVYVEDQTPYELVMDDIHVTVYNATESKVIYRVKSGNNWFR
jgi:hypothetical protein